MSKIVITVPHKKDDPSLEGHVYDVTSGYAANMLKEELNEVSKDVEVKKFDGTINRVKCDLNRKESRENDCGFRQELSKYLKNNRKDVIILYDVHSFPNEIKKSTIYFIVQDDISKYYANSLKQFLLNYYIYADIYNGINNDIIEESFSEYGIPSILIEFGENYKGIYRHICKSIARWTHEMFLNKKSKSKISII